MLRKANQQDSVREWMWVNERSGESGMTPRFPPGLTCCTDIGNLGAEESGEGKTMSPTLVKLSLYCLWAPGWDEYWVVGT